jgi:hypothetical protein
VRDVRRVLLAMLCAASCAAQTPVVRAYLEPANGILVGQPVRLVVSVFVPNYFTGSPDFPEFELDNSIVVLPQDRPQNSNEQIGGVTYAGITETYTIYPQQLGDFRLPCRGDYGFLRQQASRNDNRACFYPRAHLSRRCARGSERSGLLSPDNAADDSAKVVVVAQEPSRGRFDRKNCHSDCDKNAGDVDSSSAAGCSRWDSSVCGRASCAGSEDRSRRICLWKTYAGREVFHSEGGRLHAFCDRAEVVESVYEPPGKRGATSGSLHCRSEFELCHGAAARAGAVTDRATEARQSVAQVQILDSSCTSLWPRSCHSVLALLALSSAPLSVVATVANTTREFRVILFSQP